MVFAQCLVLGFVMLIVQTEAIGNINKVHSNETNVRQNYMTENELIVNNLISSCFQSWYIYTSMCAYCDRDDVALHGFGKFFKHRGHEERECAEKLIRYQNLRGGRVMFADIKKPERDEWATGLDSFIMSLNLEKQENGVFLEAHASAVKNGDPQLADFIAREFLQWKVHVIKHVAQHIRDLKRVGPGLGEYQVNHHLENHHEHGHQDKHEHGHHHKHHHY